MSKSAKRKTTKFINAIQKNFALNLTLKEKLSAYRHLQFLCQVEKFKRFNVIQVAGKCSVSNC